MEPIEERRERGLVRVPLESLEVELSHDAFDDVYGADGLDVCEGGIALRSAILPLVGERLRCAFVSPVDGAPIAAIGEVVWSEDSGPHLGAFGVRFEAIDEDSEASLRRLVDTYAEGEDRALTLDEADALGWPSSPGVLAAPTDAPEALDDDQDAQDDGTIAIALDGVGSELVADVVHEAEDAMLVEQALPFLRLGTGLSTEHGRRGRLASVELRIDDDVPRLVLTLLLEEGGARAAVPAPAQREAEQPVRAYGEEEVDAAAEVDADALDFDTLPDAEPAFGRMQPEAAEAEALVAREVQRPRVHVVVGEPRAERDEPGAMDSLLRAFGSLRTLLVLFRRRALPLVGDLYARIVVASRHAYGVARPRVVEAFTRIRSRGTHMLASLRSKKQTQRSQRRASVDHRTSARPRRVQGGRPSSADAARAENELTARKRKNRIVLGLAAGTVLIGALGLLMNERPIVPEPGPQVPVDAFAQPALPPTLEPALAEPEPPAPTPEPPPEPPVGGPIEQPTFPTIDAAAQDGAQRARPAGARSFGAASVPNAQTFNLRLSRPVEAVEGEETASGFRVRLTNTNSESRASPIAQAHPRVDRASILNQGENAELRIDFLGGRKPPYRVEARGSELRVMIGR